MRTSNKLLACIFYEANLKSRADDRIAQTLWREPFSGSLKASELKNTVRPRRSIRSKSLVVDSSISCARALAGLLQRYRRGSPERKPLLKLGHDFLEDWAIGNIDMMEMDRRCVALVGVIPEVSNWFV